MNQNSMIIPCSHCGTKNRIPGHRLQDHPLCGKCKAPLSVSPFYDRPVVVTDHTFHEEILSFHGPILVDCWAPWCGPCRSVAPVLDHLASEYAGKIKIAKLNVDKNPETASRYAIQSIPTMLLFKEGTLVNRLVGALPKGEIEKHIRSIL